MNENKQIPAEQNKEKEFPSNRRMNDRIAQALTKLFDRHRIVFWYDAKKELRDDFEALQLPGVEKLELTNNEYGIKYKLLREQPEQKFLIDGKTLISSLFYNGQKTTCWNS